MHTGKTFKSKNEKVNLVHRYEDEDWWNNKLFTILIFIGLCLAGIWIVEFLNLLIFGYYLLLTCVTSTFNQLVVCHIWICIALSCLNLWCIMLCYLYSYSLLYNLFTYVIAKLFVLFTYLNFWPMIFSDCTVSLDLDEVKQQQQ